MAATGDSDPPYAQRRRADARKCFELSHRCSRQNAADVRGHPDGQSCRLDSSVNTAEPSAMTAGNDAAPLRDLGQLILTLTLGAVVAVAASAGRPRRS